MIGKFTPEQEYDGCECICSAQYGLRALGALLSMAMLPFSFLFLPLLLTFAFYF